MTDTVLETATDETLPEALGAWRLAELLAERLDAKVTSADIEELVARGHLKVADYFKRRPIYAVADALALDADLVRRVVTDRTEWQAASLTRDEASARIGWHWRDIQRMGSEGRVTVGKDGRYLTADIDRLPVEADGEQFITAQAAADVLEIRHPADWRYVEAAGWVRPADTYEREVGRHRTVTVALFRLADVRAVREMPGVDWESARGLPKGTPSPLREYARLAPTRAAVVKGFAQALADRHGVEVWAWNSPYSGAWELDWARIDGAPTKDQVRQELADDPQAASYAGEITLCPTWGRITRKARELLQPDVAVILDTETTKLYGQTVEIAVIDAATGKKLMDTLVRPTEKISLGAYWVHGISDDDVADARPWEKVLPRLRKVTKDRVICAYNSEFDSSVVVGDTRRAGKKPLHLADDANWYCLMEAYAQWLGSSRWRRLGGSHRAAGDCAAARDVLVRMSKGRGTAFTPQQPGPGDPVPGPPAQTALAATVPGQLASETAPA
ncbi:3'-5' exonuclease (plasmid) [Streptomyces sp. NA02950]|uniref:3'-5' exonuclease n=1 Tax=Streptomyces sp. NA02950 TaxID=2742137 RepID=UPI0015928644|nr:3'-5' exonuclease [Streptomyces sp. NA02950]QKV98216.1 3'-5' exonuclease [Streptomyces sp. NA02950]